MFFCTAVTDVWLGWELTHADSDHSSSQKWMKTWREPRVITDGERGLPGRKGEPGVPVGVGIQM